MTRGPRDRATCAPGDERGIALLSVLMALTLLLLLALPFSVSMSRGADAAARTVEARRVELLSASARDLLLGEVALGHPTYDPTPDSDDRSEFPAAVPAAFPELLQDGKVRFGGECWDLQRFASLDAITPLLLCNLLGTTAHLTAELGRDATELQLDDAQNLPEEGYVWVDHEVVHYGGKRGNALIDCTRGMFVEQGFLAPGDHQVAESALVLDWRCVQAVAWPFDGRTGGVRDERRPFRGVGELAEIARAEAGAFTRHELDRLEAVLSADADGSMAPRWGRPERVFADVVPPGRTLTVKSALHLGAGSTVRIRNLRTGAMEYGLVMSTLTPRSEQELRLPSTFELSLLHPVTQEFPGADTVVEPLVPAPVNVNTADAELLAALFAGCRRGMDVRVHDGTGAQRITPMPAFSARDARDLADEIVRLRQELGPFQGFRELSERVFQPRLTDAGQEQKLRLLYLYRMLLTGRDSVVEMGTAPIAFRSGSLVGYRAAATLQRSTAAQAIAARHERTGVAVAQPGLLLQAPWRTQEQLEDAFRLDRRAPFWLTGPINTGSVGGGEQGNDPISRYLAHLIAAAFPDAGFGETRFPSRDTVDAAIQPGPASVAPGDWPLGPGATGRTRRGHEAFSTATDPRGRDVGKDGPFLIRNTGPRDQGPAPAPTRTHELTHPFTTADARGGAGRFAISAWFEPKALAPGVLLDYSDGDRDRNRMALSVRDGDLVYEVIDEAGLDPDPGQSPAGVQRTASEWRLPLAELALPPDTPVHVAVSAYGGRPTDLSVQVDGIARGEVRYRTRLTSSIPGYDPQQSPPGAPGQASNDPRFLLVQVENTDGFPPEGVLRIGLELFEYSEINGNAFVCVFRDSIGGRGARQIGREHRPDIPLDGNGEPTISIEELGGQGLNLDQFPDHPAGAEVELYGYAALPSPDTLMFLGETSVDGIGGFAVARGWLNNGRPISVQLANGSTLSIGEGLDPSWTGDLELADPLTTGNQPPGAASEAVSAAFSQNGGYALLVQSAAKFDPPGAQVGASTYIGGVEVIRYGGRNGNKLTGVQRAVQLPGDDGQISKDWYDGTAHNFVTEWNDNFAAGDGTKFNDAISLTLNVVPISLTVGNTGGLPDPSVTGTSEWVQLYPRGGDPADTEWVRYDAIVAPSMLVRGNRFRWDQLRFELTRQTVVNVFSISTLGVSGASPETSIAWPQVTPTAGYIGYVPRIEADFPQIGPARAALAFRGDPATATSAHPHASSTVLPCHRLDLSWGNYGALTGRPGRNDRVALVTGSTASGTSRPAVEWHTVHWSSRFYIGDLQRQQTPPELTSPDPFQLVAFQRGVQQLVRGEPRNTNAPLRDVRTMDRLVKFPSGELPAASCEWVSCGAATDAGDLVQTLVDEIDVVDHIAGEVVVDEQFPDSAQQFLVRISGRMQPQGLVFFGLDETQDFPPGGGLLQIDDEVLAYESHQNGTFTIARNGRGLLGTDPQGHDRGARVHFLTHRPAAILGSAVGARDDTMTVQALGALPATFGTLLLNRTELLHYTWSRTSGDVTSLEMPRQYPPGEVGDGASARGLFRGRYGTAPASAGAGEPVILMPFRYWDRHVPQNDDPEQSYFQLSVREAPVYFRSLTWEEETADQNVDVLCYVRADARTPWSDDPAKSPFLRLLRRSAGETGAKVLDLQATQLEVRFVTEYRPGCLDLVTWQSHAWKTAPRVRNVELDYEGDARILREQVTLR
ncbi:MAG: hypothetical protein AB7O97_00555 [Planctomycetota bacterium]